MEPQIESTAGGGFTLTLPKRRPVFMLLFLPVWLVGWAFGEITVLSDLLAGEAPSGTNLFQLAWLVGWTLGGAWALGTFAWLLAGRERIRVEQGTLTLEHVISGLGRRRAFALAHVRNLRSLPQTGQELLMGNMAAFGFGPVGALAFDYGSSTVRWGAGLDEAEARVILERLGQRGVDAGRLGIPARVT